MPGFLDIGLPSWRDQRDNQIIYRIISLGREDPTHGTRDTQAESLQRTTEDHGACEHSTDTSPELAPSLIARAASRTRCRSCVRSHVCMLV